MKAGQLLGQSVKAAYAPADYARIAPHVDTALAGRRTSFESDVEAAGRIFHYHAAFVPQLDEAGNPDGFFAMAFDISARRRSEIAQRDSEERLRTITDNVPVLISYVDRELRYQFANAMYKDWLGVASQDMLGKTVTEVFGDDYYAARASSIAQALSGHMSSVEVSVHRKGHERILNTTYMPHVRDGRIAGVYVLATDATAARSHERKLLALANADPLTNLPNRRMYEFHLVKALALARRQQTRIALMYLDLDDFKRINDTWATPPATPCWSNSAAASPPPCASPTCWPAWQATNSPWCWKRSTARPTATWWPAKSTPPCARRSCTGASR